MHTDPLSLLWQLSANQHQAFAVRQAIELGVPRKRVEHLHSSGQVPRLHQGVYAAPGSVDSPLRRSSAALLAVRGPAVLSHQTAAWLHGLADDPARTVHVLRPMGSTHAGAPRSHRPPHVRLAGRRRLRAPEAEGREPHADVA